MKSFIRPLESLLIQLRNVSHIEHDRKTITIVMNHVYHVAFMGSGGTDAVKHKIVYPTEEEAKKKFEEYSQRLT